MPLDHGCLQIWLQCTNNVRDRTQVVTGLDLKSSGPCPRRFEPCRSRCFHFRCWDLALFSPPKVAAGKAELNRCGSPRLQV